MSNILETALDEGFVSQFSFSVLNNQLGNTLQGAFRNSPAKHNPAKEVVILVYVVDDSSSMKSKVDQKDPHSPTYAEAIYPVHNMVLQELKSLKIADSILVYTVGFNQTTPVNYFEDLNQALEIDLNNMTPNGYTPLYRRVFEATGFALAKATEYFAAGKPARVIEIVITDGENFGDDFDVTVTKQLIEDVTASKEAGVQFVVQGIGIGHYPWGTIFESMGIYNYAQGVTRDDLKQICNTTSASAVRASTSQAGFNQLQNNPFAQP